jgi:membrane-anchored protein YejM (alkaline phosphatase superfamily)
MSELIPGRDWPEQRRAGYRFPALVWALLHVPFVIALYAGPIAETLGAMPPVYRLPVAPVYLPQAALVALVAWLLALPLSRWPRLYRFAAPALVALVFGIVVVDSRVYEQVRFHLNGFFLSVLVQPQALRVTGVPSSQVALVVAAGIAFVIVEALAGAWFIRRFAAPRRAWSWALALFLVAAAERVYASGLTYLGGQSVYAAATTLPHVHVTMVGMYKKLFGKRVVDQFAGQESMRLPAAVAPEEIRFTRKPDVLLVVAESLPHDHLNPTTMPRLWTRVQEGGALFTRNYSGSCSTNFSLFSIIYGLQPQKLEKVIGAGRRPLLFPAMQANGYEVRALAGSCLEWMQLRDTVFAGLDDGHVRNSCTDGDWGERDDKLLADARGHVERVDPAKPLFMFLFFFETHFTYYYGPESGIHKPDWDGTGGFRTTKTPDWMIKNRAMNAAHALDLQLDRFLTWFEAKRGRRPLVVFTGDHGEEFRQKGHIGHGSAVTDEQIHVPLAILGDGIPRGTFDVVTNHVDIVPTIFSLLGDESPPRLHSDGVPVFQAPEGRFVLSTVGWEPRHALIGKDLKVMVYGGMAGASVTDLDDRPLPDGNARLVESAGRILQAMRGEADRPAPDLAPSQGARAAAQDEAERMRGSP